MQVRRETRDLFTIVALLFALIIFNVATVLLEAEDNKKGSPARIKGQIKGSQVMNSSFWQVVPK